ncbi:hypothetical protein [Dietzia natronolimnaea]
MGIDRFGLDLSVGSATGPREVVRIPFALVCGDSEDVQSELDRLAG